MNLTANAASCFAMALVAPVLAQDLTLASVVLLRDVQPIVAAAGGGQRGAPLAAGADVTAGFSTAVAQAGMAAGCDGWFTFGNQAFVASMSASCVVNGVVQPGGQAASGSPTMLLTLSLPRAMRVRLAVVGSAVASGAAPASRATIDVGDDGVVEFDLARGAADMVCTLPAGRVPIRCELAADLPAGVIRRQCEVAGAWCTLTITPAHADIDWLGMPCGAALSATPRLDGQSVQFELAGTGSPIAAWLALGTQAANALPLPSTGCTSWLVPDVVLTVPANGPITLPLGLLGAGSLHVQGFLLQAPPWSPAPAFGATPCARVQLY